MCASLQDNMQRWAAMSQEEAEAAVRSARSDVERKLSRGGLLGRIPREHDCAQPAAVPADEDAVVEVADVALNSALLEAPAGAPLECILRQVDMRANLLHLSPASFLPPCL